MGAWGTAAFDNDDASDWVYDLEKRGMAAIDAALADVEAATDLETPTDANAIAAGEVIAAALGRPVDGLREDIQELAIFVGPDVTPDHAVRAPGRRPSASSPGPSWRELWDESAEGAEWRRGDRRPGAAADGLTWPRTATQPSSARRSGPRSTGGACSARRSVSGGRCGWRACRSTWARPSTSRGR